MQLGIALGRPERRGYTDPPDGPIFSAMSSSPGPSASAYGLDPEWEDWYGLSPQERWRESARLWDTYLLLGGTLDPEPDTQSPFFDARTWRAQPVDGRSGLHPVRRSGV